MAPPIGSWVWVPPTAWALVISASHPPGRSSPDALAKDTLGSIQWNAVADTMAS